MKTIILKYNFKEGNSSRRLLIKEGKKKFILKISDINEINTFHKYVPKTFSVNDKKYGRYNRDNCDYIFKYEYIKGRVLCNVVVDNKVFFELIKMFCYFNSKGYLVWDCHTRNILVTKTKKVFFVDLGGLTKMPTTSVYYPFLRASTTLPEEWKSDNYPNSLNSEQFTIYYLSYRLLKECKLKLSKEYQKVLKKMNEVEVKNRFGSFKQISKKLRKINKTATNPL